MPSELITKRALLPPQPQNLSCRYTEAKVQRTNNIAFHTKVPKSKADKAATKRESTFHRPTNHAPTDCAREAKEFDSSTVVSPLLDPKILERRVMAAKAGDHAAQ